MRWILVSLVLACACVGCLEDGEDCYAEGKERLAVGERDLARECFERAVSSECTRAGESHYELGRLAQGEPGGLPLALWHFRMAREQYRGGGVKAEDIENALRECETALSVELSKGRGGISGVSGDMRLKVELLEEHARKQSRWLEELRRENALLRRQLSERE